MNRHHFEVIQPCCPGCSSSLDVGWVTRESGDEILEGALRCSSSECLLEYPIVDGAPILVPDTRAFLASSLYHLTERDDLTPEVEAMLVEGAGTGSALESTRLHLSHYGWDHYGEFDPQEAGGTQSGVDRAGAVARVLRAGLELLPHDAAGPAVDLGCSVGRTTFDLAASLAGADDLAVGLDLNFSMVRLAGRVRATGQVSYPRRRSGLLYERRQFPVEFVGQERVEFWVGDALQAPFADGSFQTLVSLNLLDCVPSPLDLLRTVHRLLAPGGQFVLASPYDWSGQVSPPETWVGGHSPRSLGGGDSATILRALLTPGAHPASLEGLRVTGEIENLDWHVRVHDRCTTRYAVHVVTGVRE